MKPWGLDPPGPPGVDEFPGRVVLVRPFVVGGGGRVVPEDDGRVVDGLLFEPGDVVGPLPGGRVVFVGPVVGDRGRVVGLDDSGVDRGGLVVLLRGGRVVGLLDDGLDVAGLDVAGLDVVVSSGKVRGGRVVLVEDELVVGLLVVGSSGVIGVGAT